MYISVSALGKKLAISRGKFNVINNKFKDNKLTETLMSFLNTFQKNLIKNKLQLIKIIKITTEANTS